MKSKLPADERKADPDEKGIISIDTLGGKQEMSANPPKWRVCPKARKRDLWVQVQGII